jgi:hypothetical protein
MSSDGELDMKEYMKTSMRMYVDAHENAKMHRIKF